MARARSKKSEDVGRRCKGLIFGPPKHGKTHFLGTATFDERTAPLFLLDFDGGVLDVLDGLPGGPNGPLWYHWPIHSWSDFNEGYAELESGEYKSFAIDSISETLTFAHMNILAEKGSTRSNPDLIQQDDYGTATVQLRRLVRQFRDLPIHGFYTAHHKDDVSPKEGTIILPNLTAKLAVEIPGLMSVVGYLALEEVTSDSGEVETQRVLLLKNYAKIRTGVRTKWGEEAPDEIEDPTVTKLLDALHYTY